MPLVNRNEARTSARENCGASYGSRDPFRSGTRRVSPTGIRMGYTEVSADYRYWWAASFLIPAATQLILSVGAVGPVLESPVVLFWVVLIAATSCILTAAAVVVRAHRRREPELAYLGLLFLAVSVLPLVHGITTPGVLYGPNETTMASVVWAIPLGLLASFPMFLPHRLRQRVTMAIGRWWSPVAVTSIVGLAVALLLSNHFRPAGSPAILPVWDARSPWSLGLVIGSFLGCVILGHRQLYLARVARRRAPLVVAGGYGLVGASAFVQLGTSPYSVGYWVAHLLDIGGVFAATIGALVVFRSTRSIRSIVDPVVTVDAAAALELGIDPVVHAFVADLEHKDPITRDHVVRTAELAIAVGQQLGLGGADLRRVGLVALLHDIGKLDIPDEILTKPGRLTDDEFTIMKRHAEWGELRMLESPALAEIAKSVRAHHERVDGGGYPDGMSADQIPTYARIVSVCDAYDAMAHTRQYRAGMGQERALAILREHAGSQWDASAVDATVRVVSRMPTDHVASPLADIGRGHAASAEGRIGCDCLPRELVDAS